MISEDAKGPGSRRPKEFCYFKDVELKPAAPAHAPRWPSRALPRGPREGRVELLTPQRFRIEIVSSGCLQRLLALWRVWMLCLLLLPRLRHENQNLMCRFRSPLFSVAMDQSCCGRGLAHGQLRRFKADCQAAPGHPEVVRLPDHGRNPGVQSEPLPYRVRDARIRSAISSRGPSSSVRASTIGRFIHRR